MINFIKRIFCMHERKVVKFRGGNGELTCKDCQATFDSGAQSS